ncbi:MAG: serine protease, partial [Rhodobacteraceae bacterium]|nr:serine protease [Paracoccaceae bacterium]
MAEHFLTKSRLDLARCIRVGGDPAVECHAALQQALTSKVGPDAAKLFAEPLISKGNDQAASTVSWYSDRLGQGVPMSKLDPTAEAEFKSVLSRRLGLLEPLIDDPDVGPLVSAALHLGSPSDIWSLDGQPVLINWGLLPDGGATDAISRTEHYQRTLGRFLPLASAPPLNDAERTLWREMRQSQDATQKDKDTAAPVAGAVA